MPENEQNYQKLWPCKLWPWVMLKIINSCGLFYEVPWAYFKKCNHFCWWQLKLILEFLNDQQDVWIFVWSYHDFRYSATKIIFIEFSIYFWMILEGSSKHKLILIINDPTESRVVKWIAKNCNFAKLRIAKKSQFRN